MTEQERLAKNKQIKETKALTIERHSQMQCKTYALKIDKNALNKQQKEAIERKFIEAKWFWNAAINFGNETNNYPYKYDDHTDKVIHLDKNKNKIESTMLYLGRRERQCLLSRMKANLKSAFTNLKRKNIREFNLRFKSEINSIDLIQYGNQWDIKSSKRIRIAGLGRKGIKVNGLNQFISIEGIEYANAKLLNKPSGYYLQVTVFTPKENKTSNGKLIGLDFGIQTAITTSEGEKLDVIVEESDRLKGLQRKLSRQIKGSNNYYRTVSLIRLEYEKLNNKKDNKTNQILAKLSYYEGVIMQDEQIKGWTKLFGKKIQHSILGCIKQRLKTKDNVVVIDKMLPTTKFCPNCKRKLPIKLSDRIFKCNCGVEMDRDVHAAQNMIWFFENEILQASEFNELMPLWEPKSTLVENKISELESNSNLSHDSLKQEAATSLVLQ